MHEAPSSRPSEESPGRLSIARSLQCVLALVLTGCTTVSQIIPPQNTVKPAIAISPLSAGVPAGTNMDFTAAVSGETDTTVSWSLSPAMGTLTGQGVYTAPAPSSITQAEADQGVTVTATSVADPTLTATASVKIILPITLSVSPIKISLSASQTQQFQSVVTGSSNSLVNWSLSPQLGSVSSSGLYTAPATINSSQTVQLTATAAADTTKTAAITITLNPNVGITLAPATVSLFPGGTQQFTSVVSNAVDGSVTWSINPAVGSISASGVYTAPATLVTGQTVQVTSTSNADPTKSATSTVALSPKVNVELTPAAVSLNPGQSQSFVTVVSNTSNASVNWTINPAIGTISTSGVYTAPPSIATVQTVRVTATSQVDPTQSASSTITIAASKPVSISLTPASVTLKAGQNQEMSSLVSNTTNPNVTWTLNPVVGTISAAGLYTAPSTIPTSQTVRVVATSQADTTKTATSTISLAPDVTVSVTPGSVSLGGGQSQTFNSAVGNSTDTTVSWSLNPSVGTISNAGVYIAPSTISSTQTIQVTATSKADTTKSSVANVTLLPPKIVAVSVNPQTATLSAGQTQDFSAVVTNTTNSGLTWTLSPGVGSISSAGVYTAPSTVSSGQTIQITATSKADTTKSAKAIINLVPPKVVAVSVTPGSVSLGASQAQTFSATVTNSSNTSVTWTLNPSVGTISTSGIYTAPSTLSSGQTVVVTATSKADTTKSAKATVTLVPPAKLIAISVTPTSATLNVSQTQTFTATVTNSTNTGVTWSLSPSVGSISTSGVYTAPSTLASGQTVIVTATSNADNTKSATATITLVPPAKPVAISISPGTATLNVSQTQAFTATVTNTTNTGVTWSLSPSVGSISTSGVYTAPSTLSSGQTVIVTATSNADNTKSATATLTLVPPAKPVAISVTPTSATLNVSQTQAFTATVTNSTNTGVTWSLSPSVGSISTSGVYTAPSTLASGQTVIVTATSTADTTKSATASIALVPPAKPVAISVTPTSATLNVSQTQTFTATVTNSTNTGVSWSMSPSVGSISTSGVYTAPSTLASGQTVIVTATSNADTTKSATATITLVPPVSVSVSPGVITMGAGQSQSFAATVANTSNQGVTWAIYPANAGTISANGLYVAPATVTGPSTVTILATSTADTTKTGTATVNLTGSGTAPPNPSDPISVSVSPTITTLQGGQNITLVATVLNASNASVDWVITPAVGSISSNGVYTAPSTISNAQTVTVIAISVADQSKWGVATISLATANDTYSPTYYVDNVNGCDCNTGASPAQAFSSIAHINALSLAPGDTVAFAAGEEWHEALVVQHAGASNAPITYTSFGSGARPIISAADPYKSGWTVHSSNVWVHSQSSDPKLINFSGQAGLPVTSLGAVESARQYFWDGYSSLYVYSTSDPTSVVEVPQRNYAVSSAGVSNIRVVGLELRGGQLYNAFCGGAAPCSNWTFQEDTFNASYSNELYWQFEAGITSSNLVVTNSVFKDGGSSGVKMSNGGATQDQITGNSFSNLCNIWNPGSGTAENTFCDAVYGYSGSASDGSGTYIAYNVVSNVGVGQSSHSYGGGLHADTVVGWDIEHNVVSNTSMPGVHLEKGSGSAANHNLILASGIGTYLGGLAVRAGDGSSASNHTLEFNTIVGGYWACNVSIDQNSGYVSISGLEFRDNICMSATSATQLFADNGANASGNLFQSNSFGGQASNFVYFAGNSISSYTGLDSFLGYSTGDITGVPTFVNPSTGNYMPQSSSPAVAIGAYQLR